MAGWRQKAANGAKWCESDGRAAIAAWRSSGQSMAAFARDNEVDPQRLGWWRKRLGDSDGSLSSSLVPVVVKGSVFAALDVVARVELEGTIIDADAAQIFDKSFKRADLIEIACNMHARRYFVKALDAGDARAAVPLKAFQALYDVESEVAEADDAARLAARTARSRPIYEELVRWCETHRPLEPPSSLLGAAIRYLMNHRVALMRFLDDGVVPIDNGIVERLHRRPAVGRRNFLFAGSHAGGERAAIAYSILGTCQLVRVRRAVPFGGRILSAQRRERARVPRRGAPASRA